MSKDRKKLLHIHSSVYDKQPTPETLEVGELGVNNASGNTFISTKNSADEVVRFSEDNTIVNWMDEKEVFPYEAYVRGSDPSIKGVTVQDRAQNKSNIIIKLNQVAPIQEDTDYDLKVNGAKDIYGNLINPIGDDGYKDGAGIAIDMSNYAMIGANPSFSSITSTCGAKFNGTTEIKGTDGDCGSKLGVNVNEVCIEANDTLNIYGVNESNFGTSCDGNYVSTKTTLKGDDVLVDGNKVTIDACDNISAKTNNFTVEECANGGKVSIDTTNVGLSASTTNIKSCNKFEVKSNDIVFEQCDGASGKILLKACDEIRLDSRNIIFSDVDCQSGQTTMESSDLCLVGEEKVTLYGKATNVGIDCDGTPIATNTRVFGKGTLITTNSDNTKYAGQNNVEIVAAKDIKETATTNVDINAGAAITEIAPYILSDATGTTDGINYVHGDNYVQVKAGDIAGSAGNGVNIKLDKNGDLSETASNDITITAKNINIETNEGDVTIYANDLLCQSGKTVSIFANEGGKLTIGGNSCNGNNEGTYPITYVRRAKSGDCELHSLTVDDALDEVYDRSRISLSSTTHSGTGYAYTEYTLHQDNGNCDANINFTVNNTIVSMSAETYSPESELLKKYTFWQYVGGERKEIGEINIPKDHILKDVSIVNGHFNDNTFTPCPVGDNTCSWYIKLVWNVFDPSTGHPDDIVTYLPADDFVKDIDENNSNTDRGANVDVWYDGKQNWVSATTKVTIKNADGTGTKEFSRANGFHSLDSYTLNSVSGDVKTANDATNWTYDPFDKKVTITAATDASHINRKTVSWSYGDVKSAAGASYDPGDGTVNTFGDARTMSFVIPQSVDNINRGTLEVTHNGFTNTYDPASASTWALPHSSLTWTYEATSGKSGSDSFNTSADKTISIPTCVNHLNRHNITFQSGDVRTFSSQTYDPGKDCANSAETINIPTSLDHLIEFNGTCYEFDHDICMSGNSIVAKSFYATSDERIKENIQSLLGMDARKSDLVEFKTFNFKNDETKSKTYGVIAQDVLAAGLNEIVHKDENDNLSVDYISFLILKIANLENKIGELSNEINELKKQNNN